MSAESPALVVGPAIRHSVQKLGVQWLQHWIESPSGWRHSGQEYAATLRAVLAAVELAIVVSRELS